MGEEHDREQLLRVSFDLRLRDFESIIRAWRETENLDAQRAPTIVPRFT
jgi:hypothetical protein